MIDGLVMIIIITIHHVLGVKLWNSLNGSLVSVTSKYIFKRHSVNIFVSKYIM